MVKQVDTRGRTIVGTGIIQEFEYDTPIKKAARDALMIVIERLVHWDNMMDNYFILRLATFGNQVRVTLEEWEPPIEYFDNL
jgi:hypothetical protein